MGKHIIVGCFFNTEVRITLFDGENILMQQNLFAESDGIVFFETPEGFSGSIVVEGYDSTTYVNQMKDIERATLRIFNVKGQLVYSEVFDTNELENFVWNGKDQDGNRCARGTVYFAQYGPKKWKISLWR